MTTMAYPADQAARVEKRDLWLMAYERAGFDEKQTEILLKPLNDSETNRSPLEIVDSVMEFTIDNYADCKRRR